LSLYRTGGGDPNKTASKMVDLYDLTYGWKRFSEEYKIVCAEIYHRKIVLNKT
jgi:hypothetical protein